jgi:REP element-mobilizing transposase RayT
MLQGFHVIFSTYGFWLPNDPRGSWSTWIRRWQLLRFGSATKVRTRRSVANAQHDVTLRANAKKALTYPEVFLTGRQALSAAIGFRKAACESNYAIHACSVLPQHVHVVLGPNMRDIRRIVGHLKGRATQELEHDGLHPLADYHRKDGTLPSPWGQKSWVVYIFSEEHMRAAIRYVEDNPLKEGKRRQTWSFVKEYTVSGAGRRSKLRR